MVNRPKPDKSVPATPAPGTPYPELKPVPDRPVRDGPVIIKPVPVKPVPVRPVPKRKKKCSWELHFQGDNDQPIRIKNMLSGVILTALRARIGGGAYAVGGVFIDWFATTDVAESITGWTHIHVKHIKCDKCPGNKIIISGRGLIRAKANSSNYDIIDSTALGQAAGSIQFRGDLTISVNGGVVSGVNPSDDLSITVGPVSIKPAKKADGKISRTFSDSAVNTVADTAVIKISSNADVKAQASGDFVSAISLINIDPDLQIECVCECNACSCPVKLFVYDRNPKKRLQDLIKKYKGK